MRTFIAVLFLAAASPALAAEPGPSIDVAGAVQAPGPIALAELPEQTVTVEQATSGTPFQGSFSGPSLWDILAKAKVIDPGKGGLLRRTVTVTARDGYAVVLSYSEINPDYGNNGALMALNAKGAPRLIVPRDARAGRSVRDVVKIDVK